MSKKSEKSLSWFQFRNWVGWSGREEQKVEEGEKSKHAKSHMKDNDHERNLTTFFLLNFTISNLVWLLFTKFSVLAFLRRTANIHINNFVERKTFLDETHFHSWSLHAWFREIPIKGFLNRGCELKHFISVTYKVPINQFEWPDRSAQYFSLSSKLWQTTVNCSFHTPTQILCKTIFEWHEIWK